MSKTIIEFDGLTIEVTRKKINKLNLRIYPPDGLVKMSAPLQVTDQFIRHTLETKSVWIQKQREQIRNRSIVKELQLETGSTIVFQGKHYLLMVIEQEGPKHIQLCDELIHCYVPPNSPQIQKQMLLDAWYKTQMQCLLPPLIQRWERHIGVKVAQWRIKKMKTRWGSCNTQAARIWLNLNLIQKPQICMEYVLVHELVHLLEPSHNTRFYRLMDQFMPRWRCYKDLLEGCTR